MVATLDYRRWVARGRPVKRPRWLVDIKAEAKRQGIPFLGDLGSDDDRHLQNPFPQDHCPFSWTEWPVAIDDDYINAVDFGAGTHGDNFVNNCTAGLLPWVKYVNHRGWQYSVKNNWKPVRNSDIHLHISGRTDHLNTGLNGVDPFSQLTKGGTFVTLTPGQESTIFQAAEAVIWNLRPWVGNAIHEEADRDTADAERDRSMAGVLNVIVQKLDVIETRLAALETVPKT